MSLCRARNKEDFINKIKQTRTFEEYKRMIWENDDYMKMDDEIRAKTLLKIVPIHRDALEGLNIEKKPEGEWFRVTEVSNGVAASLTQKHDLSITHVEPLEREPNLEDWKAFMNTYLFSN